MAAPDIEERVDTEADRRALLALVRHAREGGLFAGMRALPPATADRIAGALRWGVGRTRATLQGLAAFGLVTYDPDLATWAVTPEARLDPGRVDSGRAGDAGAPGTDPIRDPDGLAPDVDTAALLEEAAEAILPHLATLLDRGGRVIGLAGSEAALAWLARRHPAAATTRLEEAPPGAVAGLVLHLDPLAVPPRPERWLARIGHALEPSGSLVLRVLESPLTPPEPARTAGRGRWHARALRRALEGGSGRAWSLPLVAGSARRAGLSEPRVFRTASDPACLHLALGHGTP